MRNLFIILISLFALNSYAKDYSPAEIQAILKENIETKKLLDNAGLALDLKTSTIKMLDSNKFMSHCDAVVFSEKELKALDTNAPNANKTPSSPKQSDMRESMRKESSKNSKAFWDSVIY